MCEFIIIFSCFTGVATREHRSAFFSACDEAHVAACVLHVFFTWFHTLQELCCSVPSWVELLPLLERTYGADRCYMFQNNLFPTSVTLSPPASQGAPLRGRWVNVTGVNILAHLHQEPITKETQFSEFKIIVNPRAVFTPTVHGVLSSQNGCSWIDRNVARMYHTR